MSKAYSVYVHIPFCLKKCNYCDFLSFPNSKDQEKYVEYLIKEISMYNLSKIKTLYFGGGTPSLLSCENIKKIISSLKVNRETEITIEVNPKTVDFEKLKNLRQIGINRISIGVQTFNDKFLKILGRDHNSQDAIECYRNSVLSGFDNISLDLIYSIPGQNISDLIKDLEILFKLSPHHFSIYSLIWEEGTHLFEKLKDKTLNVTENELEAEMFEKIIEEATSNGYKHYEISNFSKNNFESKHNINYWKNDEYIGIGLGASGYYKNKRYKNVSNFNDYFSMIDASLFPIDKKEIEILDTDETQKYKYILGLRMLDYKIKIDEKYTEIAKKLFEEGYIKIEDDFISITEKGIMFYNDVVLNFI